jgi:hypothetical protein
MISRQPGVYFFAGVLACSAVACLLLRHQAAAASREREILFQQQEQQLANLMAKQEQYSNAIRRIAAPAIENHAVELSKLRAQVKALREQTNAIGRQLEQSLNERVSPDPSAPENYTLEYRDKLMSSAGARENETHKVATAILIYSLQHQGQVPTNIESVAAQLDRITRGIGQLPIDGTNQFEFVYHGSYSDLNGIPTGKVAVVRHRETWAAPDGRMARVYGMLDGHSQIVASDDNFQSWEAEHIIDLPVAQ